MERVASVVSFVRFVIVGLLIAIVVNAPLYTLLVLGLAKGCSNMGWLLATLAAVLPFALVAILVLISRFTVGSSMQGRGSELERK